MGWCSLPMGCWCGHPSPDERGDMGIWGGDESGHKEDGERRGNEGPGCRQPLGGGGTPWATLVEWSMDWG